MSAKFKKNDIVILTEKLTFRNNLFIPVGSKGSIINDPANIHGTFYYTLDFEKYPELSPQAGVPENFLVKFNRDAANSRSIFDEGDDFSQWLEAYVHKRIKSESLAIGKRALKAGIKLTKVVELTKLSKEELEREGAVET